MATTYTRRINLYINGKEVTNDIASIKAAMAKLTNELNRTAIGSKEYYEKLAKIKQLKSVMAEHQQQLNQVGNSWLSLSKMADKFNRYFGMIGAAMASFAGVALTVKSAIDSYNKFDDKLADVMKTTGLTRDQVLSLNNELKKIDTRSAQMDLLQLAQVAGKLGISAEEDVLAFVRAADKIKVALAEDLGGDVETAINQIGKITEIFKLNDTYGIEDAMLKVGSAINSLGAAGTAAEANLVEFAKRVGGVAPLAGISIENVLGLGATLDELGIEAEVAGTTYANVVSGMFKDTQTFADVAGMSLKDFTELLNTDANEAFIKVLEGARGTGKGFGEVAVSLDALGLEGARATSVMGVLAGNIEKLREKQAFSNQEFEKGNSILNEFNVKNNTAQAKLEKAKKGFTDLQVTLGEKLTPAYTSVISKSTLLLSVIGSIVQFLFKYSGTIITLIATITAYSVATQIAVMWEARHNKERGIGLALSKLQTIAYNAQFAAIALGNTIMALLTGNIKKAAISFRAFSAALSANPIGLIVGAVVLLGAVLYKLATRTEQLSIAQKANIDVEIQAQQSIVEQKKKVEDLLKVAGDERISLDLRKKALAELNEISPEYFKNLSLEKWNTDEAKRASDAYTESLIRNARAVAAQQMMIDLEKQRIADTLSGKDKELSFIEKMKSGAGLNLFKTAANERVLEAAANEKAAKAQEDYNKQMEALADILKKNKDNPPPAPATTEKDNDGGKNKTKVETPAEKAAREKKEKEAADAAKKSAKEAEQLRKESQDKALKALDEAYAQRQLTIEQNQLKEQESEEAFKARMALAEMAFLEQKRAMLEAFGLSTVEIDRAIAQKKLDNQIAINSVLTAEQIKQKNTLRQLELQGTDKALASAQAAADEQVRIQQEEFAKKEEQVNQYLSMAEQMGDGIAQLFMDQNATLADFLRESLVMILDYLEKVMLAKIAESAISGIAQGPIGIVKAIAKAIAIKVAFGIAKSAIAGKKKGRGGYDEGGFTGSGNPSEPAGIVHKGEWVAPAHMVRNPATAGIISALENFRSNRVQPNPALVSGRIPFASGGYVTNAAGVSGIQTQETIASNQMLIEAINRFMTWKPKVYTEMIKKDLDTLDHINKNRNL